MLVVYLHGFLSGPESTKARITQDWITQHRPDIDYYCPPLSSYPHIAKQRLIEVFEGRYEGSPGEVRDSCLDKNTVLIGSSLGGYWATWLSEKYNLPTVLVNPAVNPSMFLPEYLGVELKNFYTDEVYVLGEEDVTQLRDIDVVKPNNPDNFWLMVQTRDETLDYRLAINKYADAKQLVEEGGSHSFDNYEQWLPSIIDFLENRTINPA